MWRGKHIQHPHDWCPPPPSCLFEVIRVSAATIHVSRWCYSHLDVLYSFLIHPNIYTFVTILLRFFWQISTDHWEQVFETVCRMIGFGRTMRTRFNVKKKVDGLNASIKDRTTLKTSLTIYSKYRPRWFKVLTARVKTVKEINLAELVYIDVECPFISLQQVIFCNIPVFGCYSLLGNKTKKWRQRRKIKDKGLWILM